jgi:hypothetical protein
VVTPADTLVAASHDQYRGRGDVVVFAACTAARIGEVSDCRVGDIDTTQWIRTATYTKSRPPGWRSPHTSVCSAPRARCRARSS